MLVAVRLVDLGTLVTLVVLDTALAAFAFFLYRYLLRTGAGYVPPEAEQAAAANRVSEADRPVPHRPETKHAGEDASTVAGSGAHVLGPA